MVLGKVNSEMGKIPGSEKDEETFLWHKYLEDTCTEEVPQTLFSHVEESLTSGLKIGMTLEVPHRSDNSKYWLATITMACGPLLRLRYLGQLNPNVDFWCSVSALNGRPVGWSNKNKVEFVPPDDIYSEFQNKYDSLNELLQSTLQSAPAVPAEMLFEEGFTLVDRIKQGMKLEVQDERNPYNHWIATVIENVGGRLLLRYDTPDSSVHDFWIFCTSPRLFRMGFVNQAGPPWSLQKPSLLKSQYSPEQWAAISKKAIEEARHHPLPEDLLVHNPILVSHNFLPGMKLEAIHPQNMVEICPASVLKVFDSQYFLVKIDSFNTSDTENAESIWLCTADHPYIFPVGWAQSHGLQLTHPPGWVSPEEEFNWASYIDATKSRPAPKSLFHTHVSAEELGFAVNMMLEAVNPENQHQICAASIVKIIGHLLWIHLQSNDQFHPPHIVSATSRRIFPVGWCDSNNYSLKPPIDYQLPKEIDTKNDVDPSINNSSSLENSPQQRTYWCPKIYFNHKCFSGPFLSKGKLAQLPKAVGPGPVTLVMKEVLSMLISVAYKSSRVLKELQGEGKPEPGMHLEVLKAKYKSNTYRASVAVVTSADQVPSFCKKICKQLQVCPFMFGPVAIGDNECPESCSNLSKTKFTQYYVQNKRKIGRPKGDISNLIQPKKKRGRKRLHGNLIPKQDIPKDEETPASDNPLQGEDDDSDTSRESQSQGDSSTQSQNDTNSLVMRRKYKKRQYPQSNIKTRGAKLPNFALQMRVGHWNHSKWKESAVNTKEFDRKVHSLSAEKENIRQKFNTQDVIKREVDDKSKCLNMYKQRLHNVSPLVLNSNPLHWSAEDVYQYLSKTDCAWIAQRCRDELIDGQAFMMLNLPTLQQHLYLKLGPAMKLCGHIERLKLAYYVQFLSNSEP